MVNLAVIQAISRIESLTRNISIHEFQGGVLYAYNDFARLFNKGLVKFLGEDGYWINGYFYLTRMIAKEDIARLMKKGNVYAPYAVDSLRPGKRVEITYSLPDCFDRENYKNAKKFYKHVTRPLSLLNREGYSVRELRDADLNQGLALYERWENYKMENYRIYKICFPGGRYKRCLRSSLEEGMSKKIKSLGLFDGAGRLLAYRTVYLASEKAFDCAFITDREADFEDLSAAFEATTLKFLNEHYGVTFFNCGLGVSGNSPGENLIGFKKHLPNKELIYYKYQHQK